MKRSMLDLYNDQANEEFEEFCAELRLDMQARLWALKNRIDRIPGGATPPFATWPCIVVDPSRVVIEDLLHARPGQIIRLRTPRGFDTVEFPYGIGWAPLTLMERIECRRDALS